MSHNYKTTDTSISSKASRKEVKPSQINVANIDTRVISLLQTNPYQSPAKIYSGEIEDFGYKSQQQINDRLQYEYQRSQELNNEIPEEHRQQI